jgi:hypothetical protein
MKELTAYRTKDGQVFTNKKEAEKHEADLKASDALWDLIEEEIAYFDQTMVFQFIRDNGDKIKEILSWV